MDASQPECCYSRRKNTGNHVYFINPEKKIVRILCGPWDRYNYLSYEKLSTHPSIAATPCLTYIKPPVVTSFHLLNRHIG